VDPSHAKKYTKSEIEQIIAGLLNQAYPKGVTLPIDVDLIVQQHPQIDDIIPAELLEDQFGVAAALVYKPTNGTFDIFVDEDTYTKQRGRASFSIAHEFGHVVLHSEVCNICRTVEAALELRARLKKSYSRMEQNADAFAAAMRMPRSKVQQHTVRLYEGLVGLYGYNVTLIPYKLCSDLAGEYGVSVPAMKVRREHLGLQQQVMASLQAKFPYLEL
jgi:hypothetical protein